MKTLTANITETLEDWFNSHGLAIKNIAIERRDDDYDRPRLYLAVGEFYPTYFKRDEEGNKLIKQYCAQLALVDERFEDTVLVFDTDTTFRIV